MKTLKTLLLIIAILASYTLKAQVSVTTDGSSADPSAMLEVKSSDKGFLPPRMTEAQMNAINSPAEGLIVYCSDCSPKGPYYFDGINWVNFASNGPSGMSETDVYNPATGKVWMDRNLGATRVAQSSTDYEAYGSLYQWGRGSDGHEVINWTSSTGSDGAEQANETSTLSTTDTPGHGNFITNGSSPWDWRSPQNDNLWQGVNGINNPCPSGYRLPTEVEWDAERQSWDSNDAAGAFGSSLKLPLAGGRFFSDGTLGIMGVYGEYWSSTVVDGINARSMYIASGNTGMGSSHRAIGFSVRCIKD